MDEGQVGFVCPAILAQPRRGGFNFDCMIHGLVYISIATAALSAFVLIVLEKWEVVAWLQMHATRIFGIFRDLPFCNFCLLFWIGMIITIPIIFLTSNIFYIVAPALSAPIAKAIYENCRGSS